MPTYSTESASYAEDTFARAGETRVLGNLQDDVALDGSLGEGTPASASVGSDAVGNAPSSPNFLTLLNNFGVAPATTSIVTVPKVPESGDHELVDNVQTLDSYIGALTALVVYHNHPAPYNLGSPTEAAQFVEDVANARNFVLTGGAVKAIPMYLPMGLASTSKINKQVSSADLHLELLAALFGTFGFSKDVLGQLDGFLTEVAGSLKKLQLSFTDQSQTLNYFVSYYHLTAVEGANPPINQMNVEFFYLQIDQNSWKAAVGKHDHGSAVSNFNLNLTLTRTSAVMSASIVSANTGNIITSLQALTQNDQQAISSLSNIRSLSV